MWGDIFLKQLLKHLIETVILMANEVPIPVEPPIKFPSPAKLQLLGTESQLSFVYAAENEDEMEEHKTSAHGERDKLQQEGETDHWSAKQSTIMPMLLTLSFDFLLKCCFNMMNKMVLAL
jgi:acyl-CoA synthetase (AMP-forming)/AMP-acid ligase II